MKKTILRAVCWWIFIVVSIIIIAWGGATLQKQTEEKRWNDGVCECGGHYQLFDIERHRGDEYYYYKCDKCDNVLRATHCFKCKN